jgi:hypothetical protein
MRIAFRKSFRRKGIGGAVWPSAPAVLVQEDLLIPDPLKMCINREPPGDQVEAAAQRAIAENPANAPSGAPAFGVGALPTRFMALITGKKWKPGRTLRVRFQGGHKTVQQKGDHHAYQWEQYANRMTHQVPGGHQARRSLRCLVHLEHFVAVVVDDLHSDLALR